MKIKMVSDGTVLGTRVIDAETGNLVEWVTRVELVLDARDLPRATLYVVGVEVDVITDAETKCEADDPDPDRD